nr:polynucleotidyl transferase, ribonuclease H-like superfamily protein [Tanacetum cinerariifolium]
VFFCAYLGRFACLVFVSFACLLVPCSRSLSLSLSSLMHTYTGRRSSRSSLLLPGLSRRYAKPFSLCRDLLKLDGLKQGRLLGLSIGADSIWDECVGVAVSNPSNELAEPYGVYEKTESNISRMVSDFQDLVR